MVIDRNDGVASDWRVSRVRDTDELRRWRPLAAFPAVKIVLGLDSEGCLLRLVDTTKQVIPFQSTTTLFFLPLLDTDYHEFAAKTRIGESALVPTVLDRLNELVTSVLVEALGSRAMSYIQPALRWCEVAPLNDQIRQALRELASSRRGTQKSRHLARRLARRSETDRGSESA